MVSFLSLQPILMAQIKKVLPAYEVLAGLSVNSVVQLKSNLAPAIHVIFERHEIKDTALKGRDVAYAQYWIVLMAVKHADRGDDSLIIAEASADIDALLLGLNGFAPGVRYYPLEAVTPKLPVFSAGNLFIPFCFKTIYNISQSRGL